MGRRKKYIDQEMYYTYCKELAEKIVSFGDEPTELSKELLIHIISQDEFGPVFMAYVWGKKQEIKKDDPQFEINSRDLVEKFWKEPEQPEEGTVNA